MGSIHDHFSSSPTHRFRRYIALSRPSLAVMGTEADSKDLLLPRQDKSRSNPPFSTSCNVHKVENTSAQPFSCSFMPRLLRKHTLQKVGFAAPPPHIYIRSYVFLCRTSTGAAILPRQTVSCFSSNCECCTANFITKLILNFVQVCSWQAGSWQTDMKMFT